MDIFREPVQDRSQCGTEQFFGERASSWAVDLPDRQK
jgi:hypothetical protein